MNRTWERLVRRGVGPSRLDSLEVVGRKSGQPIVFPVMVADLDEDRYLVAMLGEQWVANVRAAAGRAVLQRGDKRTGVALDEVPIEERAPIIKRFLDIAPGGRPHIPVDRRAPLDAFTAVTASYPTFRIRELAG